MAELKARDKVGEETRVAVTVVAQREEADGEGEEMVCMGEGSGNANQEGKYMEEEPRSEASSKARDVEKNSTSETVFMEEILSEDGDKETEAELETKSHKVTERGVKEPLENYSHACRARMGQQSPTHERGQCESSEALDPSTKYSRLAPEIILETQLLIGEKNRKNKHKEIMANLGLDSPNSSKDSRNNRDGRDTNHGTSPQYASTPIRNNAANLMALGQHELTPGQGRI